MPIPSAASVPPRILRRVASEDKNAPPGNRWEAQRGDEYTRLVSRWADRDADTNGVGSKRIRRCPTLGRAPIVPSAPMLDTLRLKGVPSAGSSATALSVSSCSSSLPPSSCPRAFGELAVYKV